jgi:hypothetical protein
MDKEKSVGFIESIQKTVEQMKIDDIQEASESAYESFICQCCGEEKILAGSLIYDKYLLCNDCVLIAEVSFALNKIQNIEDLIKSMEEKRFDYVYNELFKKNENLNN